MNMEISTIFIQLKIVSYNQKKILVYLVRVVKKKKI